MITFIDIFLYIVQVISFILIKEYQKIMS